MKFIKTFGLHLLLIVVFIYTITWLTGNWLDKYTRHGSYLTLPDLKGTSFDQVESQLRQKKLKYLVTDTAFFDEFPRNSVVEQNPAPQTKVKEGRIIYLTLNSNTGILVTMPNLINSSFRYAETVLTGSGLKLGDISYKPDIAHGAVLDQSFRGRSIQPGTRIPKGAEIDLVVGDGTGGTEVPLPDLSGLSVTDATNVLISSLLHLGTVVYEGNIKDSNNVVVKRQNPPFSHGLTIRSGSDVDLYVGNQ